MNADERARYIAMSSEELARLADTGDAEAQYQLGLRHHLGKGASQDNRAALTLWGKAAKSGHPLAQNNVAFLYEGGLGTPQNSKMAFFWYQKAAAQGNDLGQVNIGKMYQKGSGVGQDFNAARTWYEKAAAQGNREAQALLEKVPNEVSKTRTLAVMAVVIGIAPWTYYYVTRLAPVVNNSLHLAHDGRVHIGAYVIPILLPPILLMMLVLRDKKKSR
jgi:Sel1 repeat-containing protein